MMIDLAQAIKAALTLLALLGLTQANLSTCKISDANACAIDLLSVSTNDGSVLIFPGGYTRCAFDDYANNVTTFKSNSTYFFQVFPAVDQHKKKLLIFFQGGGTCIDKYTCDFTLQCQLVMISTRATVTDMGILNRQLGENVFNDYNIVSIPYCTGDLFLGNKYLEPFENMYSQALGNKQCLAQTKGMHLNGYNNTMAVLKWAYDNYPNLEQIVVGGVSAGSLAAQMWSTHIAKVWKVKTKGIQFQVLADSYVGVVPEYKRPASSIIKFYGGCSLIDFPDSTVTACEAETATAVDMVGSLMRETQFGQWLFIDSIGDRIQRQYYELVLRGIGGFPFTNLRRVDEFYRDLTVILDTYSSIVDVTRFNIDSEEHVWLTSDDYKSVQNLNGQLLGDVLTAWLSNSSSSFSESHHALVKSPYSSPSSVNLPRVAFNLSSPRTSTTAPSANMPSLSSLNHC